MRKVSASFPATLVLLVGSYLLTSARHASNPSPLLVRPAPLTASARQGCRLEEILLTLQTNHVIFLTGTKRPRTHCSPVTHSVLAGYRLFEWGCGMGRGTNRHAGLLVPVKLDLCEIWQIREVASPDASVQGRGGAIRIKTAKFDLLLMGLYPPPMGDWATERKNDWADKVVNAAPSRCCIVVGGDLNAHVGCVRHPEREALDLEREVMQSVESIRWKRTATERAWPSSAGTNTWRWKTHTIPEEALHIGTHWEGRKSHPGWITSSIDSSSEESADVFSSSPIDAHATIGH